MGLWGTALLSICSSVSSTTILLFLCMFFDVVIDSVFIWHFPKFRNLGKLLKPPNRAEIRNGMKVARKRRLCDLF